MGGVHARPTCTDLEVSWPAITWVCAPIGGRRALVASSDEGWEGPPPAVAESALPLLVCPRCRGALEAPARCQDCGRRYPIVDGIPVLLGNAHDEIEEWCFRAHEFARDNQKASDQLLAQLAASEDPVHPKTRARIEWLRRDLATHRARLIGLFEAVRKIGNGSRRVYH